VRRFYRCGAGDSSPCPQASRPGGEQSPAPPGSWHRPGVTGRIFSAHSEFRVYSRASHDYGRPVLLRHSSPAVCVRLLGSGQQGAGRIEVPGYRAIGCCVPRRGTGQAAYARQRLSGAPTAAAGCRPAPRGTDQARDAVQRLPGPSTQYARPTRPIPAGRARRRPGRLVSFARARARDSWPDHALGAAMPGGQGRAAGRRRGSAGPRDADCQS
jgi:hypothetical protein